MQTEDFYYGDVAESYDEKRSQTQIWSKEDEIVEAILTRLQPIDVLDVPVGTGRFLSMYQQIGAEFVGFDLSHDMLKQAERKTGSRAHLGQGDIRALPLRDASRGLVVCIRFMHLIKRSTAQSAIAEFSRVVKTGGYLLIGARVHGRNHDLAWASRLKNHATRTRRILSHWLGRANSRSHSEQWFVRTMRRNGFVLRAEHLVTPYKDGSRYVIFLAEAADATSTRIDRVKSVELFGLPGVGKTTLFRALSKDPTLTFSDGFSLMEELSLWACLRRRPIAAARLLVRLAPVWRELSTPPAKKVVVTALRQLVAQQSGVNTVCLFQEGTSHEVWRQLIAHGDLSDQLLSRLLPVSDLTVSIEAPVETIRERLPTKKHPGPINQALIREPSTGPLWDLAASAYARVLAGIGSNGRRTAVLVNQADMESGVDRLAALVRHTETLR